MDPSPMAEQIVSSSEFDLKIISRSEAKALGLKMYFTGKPCLNGHISIRSVIAKRCNLCTNLAAAKWKKKNPKAAKEVMKRWAANNQEQVREKSRDRTRRWVATNPELARERRRNWIENNREKCRDYYTRRRSRTQQATPPWVDLDVITQIYRDCRRITRETGIKHHVDHIHSLQGKNFCGLHVPWNLEILMAVDNLSKGNRLLDPSLASS